MILVGDVREKLRELADGSVHCCVTSPPYWGLRSYNGGDAEIGLESTPDEYVASMVAVFREVWRVLRDDGTLWLNLGDSYAAGKMVRDDSGDNGRFGGTRLEPVQRKAPEGLKPKDLVGIPWRVAFALQADGWYLRQDIIWAKPNPMPESVTDRCTKSHEYIFLLSKSARYYYDNEAIKEPVAHSTVVRLSQDTENQRGSDRVPGKTNGPMKAVGRGATHIRFGGTKYGDSNDPKHATKSGNEYTDTGTRNKRDVWTVTTRSYKGAHFATFPADLITPCILAGCPPDGIVLDPFFGAGTTGLVAQRHNRRWVGIELNPEYAVLAQTRIEAEANLFTETA